jgi:hypothetical protein
MNKQAITFLSLFSLILVLSVYYVMLPPVASESPDIAVSEVEENSPSQEDTPKDQSMQEELEQKREEEIKKNEEVISSNSSTNDDVSNALEAIDETKTKVSEEEAITKALNEAGYDKVFVEVAQKTIKVTVTKKEATDDDAVAVMKITMEKCNQKYTPEIKFVSE